MRRDYFSLQRRSPGLPTQLLPVGQQVPSQSHGPLLILPLLQEPTEGVSGQVPVAESQVAVWQESEGVQITGLLPTHLPAWQVSDWVQEFPSLQAVPSGAGGLVH
ncbi:MAG: hypothetical protein QOJ59_4727 [Thermomicrobiales bacterium]|nr:hypothetical protein [Thermomicrobiales bacterium]